MPDTVEQINAAATLVAILAENLPKCSWIVFPDDGLEGWIVERDDPSFDSVEAIHVWAKKFGTNVGKTGRVLITHGTFRHTPIRILAKDAYR